MIKKIIVACLLLTFTGCVAFMGLWEMDARHKAHWMLSVYNAEYLSYQIEAASEDLTELDKKILKVKKQILLEVYPLIKKYTEVAEGNVTPKKAVEDEIIRLLNRLITIWEDIDE